MADDSTPNVTQLSEAFSTADGSFLTRWQVFNSG